MFLLDGDVIGQSSGLLLITRLPEKVTKKIGFKFNNLNVTEVYVMVIFVDLFRQP